MKTLCLLAVLGCVWGGLASQLHAAAAGGASPARRTVYAWFPRKLGNWDMSAINWSAITHISFRALILNPDGSVKPGWGTTPERVKKLVETAHKHGVQVTVLAWGTNSKGSSQYLANCPETTVKNILNYMQEYNLDGVNIDDETYKEKNLVTGGSNRDLLTKFFQLLAKHLRAARADYHISFASSPVISSADRYGEAWLDYKAIAKEIDAFTVMSYCMNPPTIGWTTSAQPIAGGGKVGKHLRDYVTVIQDYIEATGGAKDKILLGIANSRGGTEWTCKSDKPLARIIGKPRKLTAEEARANAKKHGRRFDPKQKAPWYCCQKDGKWVQGWYEDDESLAAKCQLARDSGIAGVCIWVLDGAKELPSTYKVLQEHLQGAPKVAAGK